MILPSQLSVPIKVEFGILNTPVFCKEIKIGKIIKSYYKNNEVWIDIEIDSNQVKKIKKLCSILKEI